MKMYWGNDAFITQDEGYWPNNKEIYDNGEYKFLITVYRFYKFSICYYWVRLKRYAWLGYMSVSEIKGIFLNISIATILQIPSQTQCITFHTVILILIKDNFSLKITIHVSLLLSKEKVSQILIINFDCNSQLIIVYIRNSCFYIFWQDCLVSIPHNCKSKNKNPIQSQCSQNCMVTSSYE